MQKPDSSPTTPEIRPITRGERTTMVAESMNSLLSRRPQDHAVARRTGDCDEGCLGLFQRIDRVGLDRKRLEMPAGEAGTQFPEHRAGRDRRQAERVDAD